MNVINLLRADGSIIVNKKLSHALGIEAAIMYSELVSKNAYFEDRDELTDDNFFFNTVENMKEDTTLSKYQQSKAIKKLKEAGLIEQSNRGIPQKRYFKIVDNDKLLLETLDGGKKLKNSTSRSENTEHLKVKELDGNNTKVNNTKRINKRYTITSNGVGLLNYYNFKYIQTLGKEHPTVTEEQLSFVEQTLYDIQIELDIPDYDMERYIDYHFDNLPKNNDGKIFYFIGDGYMSSPILRYRDYV